MPQQIRSMQLRCLQALNRMCFWDLAGWITGQKPVHSTFFLSHTARKSALPHSSNTTLTHLTLNSWQLAVRDVPFTQSLFMLKDWSITQWLDTLHTRSRCSLKMKSTPMWSIGPCNKKRTPLCKESFSTFAYIARLLFAQLAILQSFEKSLKYTANPSTAVLDILLMPMLTPASIAASHVISTLTHLHLANAKSEMLSIWSRNTAPDPSRDTVTGAARKVMR